MNALVVLPVVLPLAGAAITLLLTRSQFAQRTVSLISLLAATAASVAIALEVAANGTATTRLGGWPAGLGITYVADRLSALMLVVGTAMLTVVLIYAFGQASANLRSPYYSAAYLALAAGVAAAFLAGDLFHLFVAFEMLLMASYVLITLEGTDAQVRSGTTYVVLNTLESLLLLLAVGLVYAATGTVDFAELPARLEALPDGVATGLNLLLLLAFGLKAAVFPLFFWLPDAYPTAPSPVTAIFAGLLTKIGVYAIIRTETALFPGQQRTLLLVIAGFTMIVGVLGAIAQSDMKRILSFHIVSQIGYMVAGIGIGTSAALAATIFFVLHQIPVKTSLFLVEGIIEKETGTSALDDVGGMLHRSGWLAALFLLPALSLAGLPPFSGFIGKLGIVEAGLRSGQGAIVAVSLVGSLLTLVSMTKIWTGVFWGDIRPEVPAGTGPGILRANPTMALATAGAVVVGLAIALFAGPLYDYCLRAAEAIVPATAGATP